MSGERIIVFIVCMFVDGARAFVGRLFAFCCCCCCCYVLSLVGGILI